MRALYMGLLLLLPTAPVSAARVRTVWVEEAAVTRVRTTPGFSTIIEFHNRPRTAVLGDQDAFKVEYVGNSLSIKPLVLNARTNLFVFIDDERFSFSLESGARSQADYILQVRKKRSKPALSHIQPVPLVFRNVGQTSNKGPLTLSVVSLAEPPSRSSLIVSFWIRLDKNSPTPLTSLSPSRIRLAQLDQPIQIESLYLEPAALEQAGWVARGTLVVRQSRYNPKKALTLIYWLSSKANSPQVVFSPLPASQRRK